VDGDDNVWVSQFAGASGQIAHLCGVRTETCPPGMKTGDQISPPAGYVGARRDRLEAHIEAALPDWSLAPVVRASQALRGMALIAAATLVAELGDITCFANPRQLMAYLGLVPSEHSNGATRRQGGITKAGNSAARRMLIEAAWSYRFPARVSREQLLRQDGMGKRADVLVGCHSAGCAGPICGARTGFAMP
jgi:hypothetical protein